MSGVLFKLRSRLVLRLRFDPSQNLRRCPVAYDQACDCKFNSINIVSSNTAACRAGWKPVRGGNGGSARHDQGIPNASEAMRAPSTRDRVFWNATSRAMCGEPCFGFTSMLNGEKPRSSVAVAGGARR